MHGSAGKKGGGEGGEEYNYNAPPPPFYKQASGQAFKDDVNGFSSTSERVKTMDEGSLKTPIP